MGNISSTGLQVLFRLACKSDVDIFSNKMFYSCKGEKIALDQESTLVSIPQSIEVAV